jgi:rfaE bifunctional protein nucleotidyltransferase chain/domain
MFKIGILQFDVLLGETAKNLATVEEGVKRLADRGASLVCLPEMFSTGFYYEDLPGIAKESFSRTVETLERLGESTGALIAGSLPEPADEGVYNTLHLVGPGGIVATARKVHLFRLHGEHEHFLAGSDAVVAKTELGRVGLMVCYDLRFPELARSLALSGARLIIVPAQWPLARVEHYLVLCRARALENQLFLVASNRSGKDPKMEYCGSSVVVSPTGDLLAQAGCGDEELLVEVDPGLVEEFRGQMDCLGDRRPGVYAGEGRVLPRAEAAKFAAAARERGQKIVFTNGCFDILHAGHVDYLKKASMLGDVLVVGLNSDTSVRGLKGEGRPIVPEGERGSILASLRFVDVVAVFDEPDPLSLIKEIRPDVLVKGADWGPGEIIGSEEVKSWGGSVARIPLTDGLSTTNIIERAGLLKR